MAAMVREPAVAGQFYPGSAAGLLQFMAAAVQPGDGGRGERARALIVPHAGYRYSGPTAGRCFACVEPAQVRRVMILGPSHRVAFRGVSVAPYTAYRTPTGTMAVDEQACAAITAGDALFCRRAECHRHEHSVEVQIPFVQHHLSCARLVPLVVGELAPADVRRVAAVLSPFWTADTLVVVSSDFTHYGRSFGYRPFAERDAEEKLEQLDGGAIDRILALDTDGFRTYVRETGATVCGRVPITILLAMAELHDSEDLRGRLLEYTTSGAMTGDFSHSVSYAGIAITTHNAAGADEPPAVDATGQIHLRSVDRTLLLKLVRDTVGARLRGEHAALPAAADARLFERGAVFVTLHKHGRLRGCIGTLEAREGLIESVRRHAVSAAFEDPRFPPVQTDELDEIDIEISYLTPMRPIRSLAAYDVTRHGIVLSQSGRRAVFLPQVATEQGWDRDTTLEHLARKAQLPAGAWRAVDARFSVFEAVVFGETDSAEPRPSVPA